MPSKGNRAKVWKYFHKEGEQRVVCRICGQRLSYRSSTSTMRYHLERKHPLQWNSDHEVAQQNIMESVGVDSLEEISEQVMTPDVVAMNNRGSYFSPSPTKATAITLYITELLIRDLLPLREIRNPGIMQLLKYLEPSYTMPDRDTILSSLARLYEDVKPSVQLMLEDVAHLSLTTDIFNSIDTHTYATVSANWISDEWHLKSCVLATHQLPSGSCWEDVETLINETLSSFSIPSKRISAVSCPIKFINSGASSFPVVKCFASTLSVAVQKGFELPSIAKLIVAARKLVGNVTHLSGSIVELALQQTEIKVSEIQIEQDVSFLWFSTLTMLEQLRDQRSIICAIVGDTQMSKASDGLLGQSCSAHWELLNRIVDILQPLKTSIQVLSSVKNISLSSVYPILHGLTTIHLADCEECQAAYSFKQTIRNEITSLWHLDLGEKVTETIPALSSMLDTRYHTVTFMSEEHQSLMVEALNTEVMSTNIERNSDNEQCGLGPGCANKDKANLSAMDFLLGRHIAEKNQPTVSTRQSKESELKLYRDATFNPPIFTECDPLLWWQGNGQRFPHLEILARKYLCIPATCVPTERIFSDVNLTFDALRAQLEPDCIDYILFLNSNMPATANKA